MAKPQTRNQTAAPGGMTSPQGPGMTPDRTIVPGHVGFDHPPAATKRRPLTQYGSAEEIMGVFRRKPEGELQASDFEQAPPSYEELANADPALLTPVRPLERVPTTAAALEGGEAIRELQSESTPENAAYQVPTASSIQGASALEATGTGGAGGAGNATQPQGATER